MLHIKINAAMRCAVAVVSIVGVLFASTAALAEDSGEHGAQAKKPASVSQLLRLSGMRDLWPCKTAAAKHCDRSGGMNTDTLQRCGATLAAMSEKLGNQCREVLRRYGQLN